jgi:hypothetical protein
MLLESLSDDSHNLLLILCCSGFDPPGVNVLGRAILEVVGQTECAAQQDFVAQVVSGQRQQTLLRIGRHI